MRRPFNQIHPGQAVALCTREQAEKLVDYDHHVVQVNGRAGVMLTHEWMPLEEHTGSFILTVVFHSTDQHPHVPAEIQAIVNAISFQFRGQPR
jgi:hypothetical protein